MPVSKIDPNVIFASDAPSTDKPPVFNDKTKGWDEARTNDGRPTIKQMNKLQQDTDLKILWLNENAVAPYDESIDYPEGAVTLKDGSFQIFEGGTWVEFLDKSSIGLGNVDNTSDLNKPISTATQTALNAKADLDPVKRGIANIYDSSLSYNVNDRVLLDDGTEVISTIANNTNDPNVNMTGWRKPQASEIFDASGLSQQQINGQIINIKEFGGSPTDFNPSIAEAEAKAVANPNAIPYIGARQCAYPMQTLKVWNYLDGYRDRGAVASFRNVDSFDSEEPSTQVVGIHNAAGLASYPDRDIVGLYVQTEGQPTLLTSSNTTFTATTVTCSDFASVFSSIRKDQIIDVVSGSDRWSSIVQEISGNTITIETAWYLVNGDGATGTPPSGSQLKLVPNTKAWGQNTNVLLHETSDATRIAGFELGVFNNKATGNGYGFDVISAGAYKVEAGYQARGKLDIGYKADSTDLQYAFVSQGANIGLNTSATNIGVFSYKPLIGLQVQEPSQYSFAQLNSSGGLVTGINASGGWENLRYRVDGVALGGTIENWTVVAIVNASTSGGSINLPAHSAGKTVYVRNSNAANSVLVVGTMEGGGGGLNISAKTTVQFVSDGSFWYPLSKYTA